MKPGFLSKEGAIPIPEDEREQFMSVLESNYEYIDCANVGGNTWVCFRPLDVYSRVDANDRLGERMDTMKTLTNMNKEEL
jgi:hypothetical protein